MSETLFRKVPDWTLICLVTSIATLIFAMACVGFAYAYAVSVSEKVSITVGGVIVTAENVRGLETNYSQLRQTNENMKKNFHKLTKLLPQLKSTSSSNNQWSANMVHSENITSIKSKLLEAKDLLEQQKQLIEAQNKDLDEFQNSLSSIKGKLHLNSAIARP